MRGLAPPYKQLRTVAANGSFTPAANRIEDRGQAKALGIFGHRHRAPGERKLTHYDEFGRTPSLSQ
jgi:hypothetical protein